MRGGLIAGLIAGVLVSLRDRLSVRLLGRSLAELLGRLLAGLLGRLLAGQRLQPDSAVEDLVYYETLTKQCLNAQGVSVATISDYLCFGREMWSKCKTHSGETMSIEASVLISKWVARGLTLSVLETIRTGVFNVGPPAAP